MRDARRLVAALLVLAAVTNGCGDDEAPEAGSDPSVTSTTPRREVIDEPLPPITTLDVAGATAIDAGAGADWVSIAADAAWVANVGGGVRRYDVTTGAEIGTTPVPGVICLAMDVGFDSLWAGNCENDSVVRIDLASGDIVATIQLGIGDLAAEASLAVGETGVYAMSSDQRVARIDPATNSVAGTFDAPGGSSAVRAGFDSLWFSRAGVGELTRADPQDGSERTTVAAGLGARFLAVGDGAVWVMANEEGTVTRVDPDGRALAKITVAEEPIEGGDIAVGGGFVWARVTDAVVVQINARSNAVIARFGAPAGSGSVAADDRAAWISAHDVSTVWRLPLPPG